MREKNGMVYMDYDEWIARKRARTAFHQELCPVSALLKKGRGVSELSCTCPQHLPECILPKGYGDCICGELTAHAQRVLAESRQQEASSQPIVDPLDEHRQYDQDLRDAYAAGLDAAWIAVGNVPCATTTHGDDWRDIPGPTVKRDALAAIDALRTPTDETA